MSRSIHKRKYPNEGGPKSNDQIRKVTRNVLNEKRHTDHRNDGDHVLVMAHGCCDRRGHVARQERCQNTEHYHK